MDETCLASWAEVEIVREVGCVLSVPRVVYGDEMGDIQVWMARWNSKAKEVWTGMKVCGDSEAGLDMISS